MGGITDFLIGGEPQDSYQKHAPTSVEDKQSLHDFNNKVNSLYGAQLNAGANAQLNTPQYAQGDKQIQDTFRQHLMDFMTHDQGPNPSPDQLKQAQDFVDQTFTNPAQNSLNDYTSQFNAQQQAQAAALGRNPNLDQATNQAIYNEGARNQRNIQTERGSRVAQTALGLNQEGYNRGLNGLQAGISGINAGNSILGGNLNQQSFLNGLQQQAFGNQLNLLNASTFTPQFNQRDRIADVTQGGGGTSSGLLTNINGIQNGMFNVGAGGSAAMNEGTKLAGSVGSMAGMMSDRRVKKDIKPSRKEIYDFLDNLTNYSYTYKNQNHGIGTHYSVMAQDLEKTPVGQTLVFETQDGKAVNYAKAFAVLLAANVELHQRVKELEAR